MQWYSFFGRDTRQEIAFGEVMYARTLYCTRRLLVLYSRVTVWQIYHNQETRFKADSKFSQNCKN